MDNTRKDIDTSKDNEFITFVTNSYSMTFILFNSKSLQFYGFVKDIMLTFDYFVQCDIQDEDDTSRKIKACSFINDVRKNTIEDEDKEKGHEEEIQFIKIFIKIVFSAIKRRFPIQKSIQLFKDVVFKEKGYKLWGFNSSQKLPRVTKQFVISYLLRNSEPRLKIELMSLLYENEPLPLFLKTADSKFEQNRELLWIAKKGFVLTSIGLHNSENIQNETGKSSLLAKVFNCYFEESYSRHAIIRGIPNIYIRVFQNYFPMHVIDVPHDCPQQIVESILKITNLLMVHSWKSLKETESFMNQIRYESNIPIICLMRDINNLKSNVSVNVQTKGNILEMANLQQCSSKQQIQAIQHFVYQHIDQFLKNKKSEPPNLLMNLLKPEQYFLRFNLLIDDIEKHIDKKTMDLTPICTKMKSLKTKEKNISSMEQEVYLCPPIIKIIQSLVQVSAAQKNTLLCLLRQRLKTKQKQMIVKYQKIYEYRDYFKKQILQQRRDKNTYQRSQRIRYLNHKLSSLTEMNPQEITYRQDRDIQEIISNMMTHYEENIKPKILSMELFWRQINYIARENPKLKIGGQQILQIQCELKAIQMKNGYPFQLINGDTMDMPRQFLKNLFKNNLSRVLVITILGPQSSGKSTLLNFLLGCNFATSQGRCTVGVYGTFYKFNDNGKGRFNKIKNYEGIFIMDTEGIFSMKNKTDEKERKDYDKKLILFCMAVSDVVILNVTKNFDQKTASMVEFCNSRLNEIHKGSQSNKKPEIVVVLNQNMSSKLEDLYQELQGLHKCINFSIERALPQAFDNRNYSYKELFGENQIIKSQPKQYFYKQTQSLLKEIFQKVMENKYQTRKMCDIMETFEMVWSKITLFKGLVGKGSAKHCQLSGKIQMWKSQKDQIISTIMVETIQKFKNRQLTSEQSIYEKLMGQKQQMCLEYNNQFGKYQTDEELTDLYNYEKAKIQNSKTILKADIQRNIEKIKMKQKQVLAQIEGQNSLKELIRQYKANVSTLTKDDKKEIFYVCWNQQLQTIKNRMNPSQDGRALYSQSHSTFDVIIQDKTGSVSALTKSGWIGESNQIAQDIAKKFRARYISQREKIYEDSLSSTDRQSTNIFKNAEKESSSSRFLNMGEYFQFYPATHIIVIRKDDIQKCLNFKFLEQIFKTQKQKSDKEADYDYVLKRVWDEINQSLQLIGLKPNNFNHFKELLLSYEYNIFSKFWHYGIYPPQKKIQYDQCNQRVQHEKLTSQSKRVKQQGISLEKEREFHSKQKRHICKHKFSDYLHQFIKIECCQECLCSCFKQRNPLLPRQHVQKRLYQHINWEKILKDIKQNQNYKRRNDQLNCRIKKIVNENLQQLNLEILEDVVWQDYLYKQSQLIKKKQKKLMITNIKQPIKAVNYQQIQNLIDKSQFILKDKFNTFKDIWEINNQNSYYRYERNSYCELFRINTSKWRPKKDISFLKSYIQNNTLMKIQQFKKNQSKQFIMKILNEKQSFNIFYKEAMTVVKVIYEQYKKITIGAFKKIYIKVNDLISEFNSALEQVSSKLSQTYIGFIYQAAITVYVALQIEERKREQEEMLHNKKKDEQNELKRFMDKMSKDENKIASAEADQVAEAFIKILKDKIKERKQECMEEGKISFERQITRQRIQQQIDAIFYEENEKYTEQQMFKYLENMKTFVEQKYQQYYDKSLLKFTDIISSETMTKDLFLQFFNRIDQLEKILQGNAIDDQKNDVSDFLQVDTQILNLEKNQINVELYEQNIPQILYEYFIDSWIGEKTEVTRQCAGVKLKPKIHLGILSKVSPRLTEILILMKNKALLITNIIKFIRELKKNHKNRIRNSIDEMMTLKEQDKREYLNYIKVEVCKHKCPGCGRICGLVGDHPIHQVKYGHQIRALNGVIIEFRDGTKQPSVLTCEMLNEFHKIQYKGGTMIWKQFKQYWTQMNPNGWSFDDLEVKNQKAVELKKKIWQKIGPTYCERQQLRYVPFNALASEQFSISSLCPIHYIFALDESGSMVRHWAGLMTSFSQTIQSIKEKLSGHEVRVSTILFADDARIVGENEEPINVDTNIHQKTGGTNFDPPLKLAAEIARRYIQNSLIVFIFMTDGLSWQPENGIRQLKEIQAKYPDKLKYAGIQFKSHCDVMKIIQKQLNGQSGKAHNFDELTGKMIEFSFKEIIPERLDEQ